MKILCIGRNYVAHAKELNNPVPAEPVFFMKPDSSLVVNNKPFFYPEFSNDIHFETEIVLKVCKVGKHIQKKFAHTYYDEIALGIDFTARDIQQRCKEKGLPWEAAKAFDHSAPLSQFIPKDEFSNIHDLNFSLQINGEERQNGNTSHMIFSFDDIIVHLSKYVTLKMGDLIYTGTPAGVGPVQINDRLEGYIEDRKMLDFKVK